MGNLSLPAWALMAHTTGARTGPRLRPSSLRPLSTQTLLLQITSLLCCPGEHSPHQSSGQPVASKPLCFLQMPPEESQASIGILAGELLGALVPAGVPHPYAALALVPHDSVHALHIISLLHISTSSDLFHSLGWLPRKLELTQLWSVQKGQPLAHADPGLFSVGTSR